MPVIRSWARTDVGKKRPHNEDAYLVDEALGLYAVADGMGGHAAGEIASAAALKALREALAEEKPVLDAFAASATLEARERAAQLVERAGQKAGAEVYGLSIADPSRRGMGTTLVALVACGRNAVLAHVGDSRVYLFRNERVHQLTEDHTMVQEQLKRGLITKADAATAENRNVITRAIGVQRSVAVDTLVTDLLPGDVYVLCSDGLHGYLGDDELPSLLGQEKQRLGDLLIDLAPPRGGQDNVTAVAPAVDPGGGEGGARREGRGDGGRGDERGVDRSGQPAQADAPGSAARGEAPVELRAGPERAAAKHQRGADGAQIGAGPRPHRARAAGRRRRDSPAVRGMT